MRLLLNRLACLALLFTACSSHPSSGSKDKVLFVRVYHDYGWTSYGADSVKLAKPLQLLLGVYFVEYELNPSSLLIRKRNMGDNGAQTVLLAQALNKADSKRVAQHLAATQPTQLARLCQDEARDDGFRLNITLTKAGSTTKFEWTGGYETNLVDLLDVVNKLAPQKYQFYELGQQEAFEQSALHVHGAFK